MSVIQNDIESPVVIDKTIYREPTFNHEKYVAYEPGMVTSERSEIIATEEVVFRQYLAYVDVVEIDLGNGRYAYMGYVHKEGRLLGRLMCEAKRISVDIDGNVNYIIRIGKRFIKLFGVAGYTVGVVPPTVREVLAVSLLGAWSLFNGYTSYMLGQINMAERYEAMLDKHGIVIPTDTVEAEVSSIGADQ